jgi:hypothetical protein
VTDKDLSQVPAAAAEQCDRRRSLRDICRSVMSQVDHVVESRWKTTALCAVLLTPCAGVWLLPVLLPLRNGEFSEPNAYGHFLATTAGSVSFRVAQVLAGCALLVLALSLHVNPPTSADNARWMESGCITWALIAAGLMTATPGASQAAAVGALVGAVGAWLPRPRRYWVTGLGLLIMGVGYLVAHL